jgi:hypothetical protein
MDSSSPPFSAIRSRKGISIIELLAVMAMTALLATFVMPAVGSLARSSMFGGGIYAVSGALELARSHAMSRGTYVWVAMTPARGTHGELEGLHISTFASVDRTHDLRVENLSPVARPAKVRGSLVAEVDGANLSGRFTGSGLVRMSALEEMARSAPPTAQELPEGLTGMETLRFDPRGGVMLRRSGSTEWEPVRWFEIGLTDLKRGSTPGDNVSALQISGLTGQVLIYR